MSQSQERKQEQQRPAIPIDDDQRRVNGPVERESLPLEILRNRQLLALERGNQRQRPHVDPRGSYVDLAPGLRARTWCRDLVPGRGTRITLSSRPGECDIILNICGMEKSPPTLKLRE